MTERGDPLPYTGEPQKNVHEMAHDTPETIQGNIISPAIYHAPNRAVFINFRGNQLFVDSHPLPTGRLCSVKL